MTRTPPPAPSPPPCISPAVGAVGGPSFAGVALASTDAVTHPARGSDLRLPSVVCAGDGIGFLIALVLSILGAAGMWWFLAWVVS